MPYQPAKTCRSCGAATRDILDLGQSPAANRLARSSDDHIPLYPLGLVECGDCTLVQNSANIDTADLFDADYPYLSSVSLAVKANSRDLARSIANHLGTAITALDLGSNDGTTQLAFGDEGIACFGVDPASSAVAIAHSAGCDVHCAPFDDAAADIVLSRFGRVDVVTMSNVLAHVPDPGAMLDAAARTVSKNGLLVVEVQNWLDLVRIGGFDMVYHEHHSHFSLTSLLDLLGRHGFGAWRVQTTPAQGGSLRVWCTLGTPHAPDVLTQAADEAPLLRAAPETLNQHLETCRASIPAFVTATQNRRVAGYGAAAKTVTFLAACGSSLGVERIADNAPTKIGQFLPLHAIPIVSPADMLASDPDVVVVFAWNLIDEILPQLSGRDVWVPLPTLRRVQ